MKLKKSSHAMDAAAQMNNAISINNPGRWDAALVRNSKKWDITSTLVYTLPNGIKQNFYLDSNGDYVFQSHHYSKETEPPTIGEVIETDEMPVVGR